MLSLSVILDNYLEAKRWQVFRNQCEETPVSLRCGPHMARQYSARFQRLEQGSSGIYLLNGKFRHQPKKLLFL